MSKRHRQARQSEPGMPEDPVFLAGVDMLRRTGCAEFQIRYSDEEKPVVWVAVVRYDRPDGVYYDSAAGMTPTRAVLRLCETMIDGGHCQHCKRPTGLSEDIDQLPMDELFCWYQYDPELRTFRRGCAGDE